MKIAAGIGKRGQMVALPTVLGGPLRWGELVAFPP